MDVFDVVLQWSCGLTGEWAQTASYHYIKVMRGVGNGGDPVLRLVVTEQATVTGDSFMTPLSPLSFYRLPVWQIVRGNTQIMWNWELISVDLGGGSGGTDYPSSLTNLGLFFFHINPDFLGGGRIKLARHQFILLNFPEQLRAHVPEVGHVSTSHGIMKESPTLILVLTPHLLQLGANADLPDAL